MAAGPSSVAYRVDPAGKAGPATALRPPPWRPAGAPAMTFDAPPFDVPYDDPAWFLDDLDLTTGLAQFIRLDRGALSREPFLDPRWRRDGLERTRLPGSALDLHPQARPKLNFIWHTSYCCSTLIAAALDAPGRCLALKEPQALVGLANLKRGQQGTLKRPGLAQAVFALMARRFRPAEQVLIKPSNYANNLLPEAAAMTDGRHLMLYSSCRRFLVSVLKRGEDLRGYPRELFVSLANDGHPQASWPMKTLLCLTDLQMAALAWHMQVAEMSKAMAALGDRAVSLDGDAFLADPKRTLEALNGFFGLELDPAALEAAVDGGLLVRDVKTGEAGAGKAARDAEAERIERELGPKIDQIVDWAARASGVDPAAPVLPNPLAA